MLGCFSVFIRDTYSLQFCDCYAFLVSMRLVGSKDVCIVA